MKIVVTVALIAWLRSALRAALVKGQTILTVAAAVTVFVILQTLSCLAARPPLAIEPRTVTTTVPGTLTFNVAMTAVLEARLEMTRTFAEGDVNDGAELEPVAAVLSAARSDELSRGDCGVTTAEGLEAADVPPVLVAVAVKV